MYGKVVVFSLPPRSKNVELSKFCQRFYGQDSSSGGGKYHYHRHGLLDDIPHRKLLRGVVIVRTKDVEQVIGFLERYDAEIHVRRIELSEEDEKHLIE